MLGGREIARRFVRRRRGWDEVYQVEAERLPIFLGRPQMAEMDRIETAAEQSYPHAVRLCARGSGANLSVAGDHVFVGGQFVQPHRPSRVETVGGNSGFGAESEFEAVGEPRRRVNINGSRIDLAGKASRRVRVAGDDGIGKMRAVTLYKRDRVVERIDDLYRQDHVEVFDVPILGAGDARFGSAFHRRLVAPKLYNRPFQRSRNPEQQFSAAFAMH